VSQIVPIFDEFFHEIALSLSQTVVATAVVFPSASARTFFRFFPNRFLLFLTASLRQRLGFSRLSHIFTHADRKSGKI
jgi:hypothetical protein